MRTWEDIKKERQSKLFQDEKYASLDGWEKVKMSRSPEYKKQVDNTIDNVNTIFDKANKSVNALHDNLHNKLQTIKENKIAIEKEEDLLNALKAEKVVSNPTEIASGNETLTGYIKPANNWYNFKQRMKKSLGKVNTVVDGIGDGLSKPIAGAIQFVEENSDIPEEYQIKNAYTPEAKEQRIKEKLGHTPYADLNKGEKRLYSGGEIAGTLARYAATYATAGPLVEKAVAPLSGMVSGVAPVANAGAQLGAVSVPKVGRLLGSALITEGAKDLVIGTPQSTLEAIGEGKKGKELTKEIGTNMLYDVAANAVFFGTGEALSTLKATKEYKKVAESIENTVRTLPETQAKEVINQEINNIPTDKLNDIVIKISNTNKMTQDQLKTQLSELELDTNGTKSELRNRLKSSKIPIVDEPINQTNILPKVSKEPLNVPNMKPKEVIQADDILKQNIDTMTDTKKLGDMITSIKELLGITKNNNLRMDLQRFAERAEKRMQELAEQAYKNIELKGETKSYSFPQGRVDVEGLKKNIKDIVEQHPLEYNAINNKDTLETANKLVETSLEASKNMIRNGNVYDNAVESAVGMQTIEKMFKEHSYDEAFELLEKHSDKLKRMGQANQIASAWAKTTPQGMVKWTDKIIKEAKEKGLKLATGDTKEFKENIYKEMEIIQSIDDPQEMINQIQKTYGKKIPKWADNQLSKQTQDKLKEIATEQVLNEIRGLIKPSIWKKISTTQAMSHLINVPTAMRNIFGNLTFNEAERMSNLFSIPIDKLTSLKTGNRTLTTPTSWKKTIIPAVDKAKESIMLTKLGIDSDVGKYTIQRGSSFNSKIGKTGEKLLSYELKAPDEFFKGQIKEDILQQQMKLAGITKPTKEMIDIAEEEMLYRTFQDDSLPSKALQGIKDTLNVVGVGQEIRGSSGLMTREFGLGDLVVKYPRVPGNIISRAVEYTPAGYLKAIYNLAKVGKDPKLQRKAVMAFGRATNGSLMIGMAALMHQKGLLISDDAEKDKDLKALEKSEGLGGFKINLSGIERLLKGDSTELKKGDELSTLNWIEPVGKSWAIGAAINREVSKGKSKQEVATASLNQALEEVLDLPTLSIVKNMFYTGMRKDSTKFDVMITPVTEAIPGFVPGPIRHIAKATDPIQREQYSGKPTERLGKRIKGSIPGMSKSLVPKISPTGEEIIPQGKGSRVFLNRMLNPAIQKEYNPNSFTPKLKQIEKFTGKTTIYPPSIAPSYITNNKARYNLTDREKAEFLKVSGQIIKKEFTSLGDVTQDNAEKQAKKIEKIIKKAREEAKKHILENRKNIIPKVGAK
ncbi:MAG: hypothetical protein N4A63_05165 [Vallitalea sp.]|jgi:hypothetical protein|nr:hypothetical protein [Vallitalea sp.]